MKSPQGERTHVVVTPTRNEKEFVLDCIQSMKSQTIIPSLWVIVDDNSDDGSSEIIRKAAAENDWIIITRPEIPGPRRRGGRVAKLVNHGIGNIDIKWEFLSKIDCDMILDQDYFQNIFNRFDEDESLGIASGTCFNLRSGRETMEVVSADHTRGGLKTYRNECYEEIGGIRNIDGWDGMDNVLAQMRGWKTKSFLDIKSIHQRETGSYFGKINGNFESGRIAHFMGYLPLFMLGRVFFKFFERPYIVGGISLSMGYLYGFVRLRSRVSETDAVESLRRRQRSRILEFLRNPWSK